jgi:hypothetical protein
LLDRSFADLAVWCIKLSDLRHHASMGDRYRTQDGWAVEVVGLCATPDRSDGERLKVTYCGFFVALVRTVAELEQWFALSDLEPETLISRRERAGRPVPLRQTAGAQPRPKPGWARHWRSSNRSARPNSATQWPS